MIYLELFLSFLQVGLFSIGGGYAAIPLIQSQAVETRAWLTMSEFSDLVTIAEMTPGPIAVNAATFVGLRIGGILGALVATAGCIFPALIIVSVLAYLYYHYKGLSVLQSILASLRPAVVALIAGAGLSILLQVVFGGDADALTLANMPAVTDVNWVGLALFALAFLSLRRFKWNPILVMVLCGVANLAVGMTAK